MAPEPGIQNSFSALRTRQDAVLHAELVPLAVGFLSVLLQGSSRLVLVSGGGLMADEMF